jgi:hypothetical protein
MTKQHSFKVRDRRNKNWFWLDNDFLNGYAKIFGAVGTAIYVSLCRHADGETQECFPGQEKIAEELNISARTVRKYLKLFEKYNLIAIKREKDFKTKKWLNNTYILLDKSEWKKPEEIISDGKPEENNDTSQRKITTRARGTQRPNNNTHNNNTHNNNIYIFSKENSKTSSSSYGNPDINYLMEKFKEITGLKKMDGSEKQNRRYCWLCIKKFGSRDNVEKILKIAIKSDFHRVNLTSFKYLYYNGVKIINEFKEKVEHPTYIEIKNGKIVR